MGLKRTDFLLDWLDVAEWDVMGFSACTAGGSAGSSFVIVILFLIASVNKRS